MVGESDQNVFLIQINTSRYPSSRYCESTVVRPASRALMVNLQMMCINHRTSLDLTETDHSFKGLNAGAFCINVVLH